MSSKRLDEKLAPAMEEAEIAQVWRGVRAAQAEKRAGGGGRWRIALAVAVTIAAIAAIMVAVTGTGDGRRAAGDGERAAGDGEQLAEVGGATLEAGARIGGGGGDERVIAMSDGSKVTLAKASELEVLANERGRFVTAVRKGRAAFEVKAGGPRTWVVETDLATVEVVGTAFVVERSEQTLVVAVERGVVMVRGERVPGRVVRLKAGERIEVVDEKTAAVVDGVRPSTRPRSRSAFAQDGDIPDPETRIPSPVVRDPSPVTRDPFTSPSTSTPTTTSAERAIQDADGLIAKGDAKGAADVLEAYLDDASEDAGAGLAAFLLGRIAQDQLKDPERAAAAFARTIQIGSPRAVQEEARVRRARALDAMKP